MGVNVFKDGKLLNQEKSGMKEIVSVNKVENPGGNIQFLVGPGLSITANPSTKKIEIRLV